MARACLTGSKLWGCPRFLLLHNSISLEQRRLQWPRFPRPGPSFLVGEGFGPPSWGPTGPQLASSGGCAFPPKVSVFLGTLGKGGLFQRKEIRRTDCHWREVIAAECPLKLICWNPNPQEDGIQRSGHWEVIRPWGWSLHDGSVFVRKGHPLSFCHVRTQQEDGDLQAGKGSSPDTGHTGTLISDFQPPELWKIHFCYLSHPVYGILL